MNTKTPKSPRAHHRIQLEATITVLKDEIQRLTQELNHVRTDLKLEKAKTCDLGFALKDRETEMEENQKNFDRDMRDLVSKLLLLESDFRKEQREIQTLLNEKDAANESLRVDIASKTQIIDAHKAKIESLKTHHQDEMKANEVTIESQRQELEALKRANSRLLDSLSQIRPPQDTSGKQKKLRRSSTPTPTREFQRNGRKNGRKNGSPEWTEELSEFF